MPIVSGGGGGGGNTTAQVVSSGKVLPTANPTGVTVDSTTYADPIAGGGAKLTTLVFPTDQGLLGVAVIGDAFPRWLLASDAKDGIYFGSGSADPYAGATGASVSTGNEHNLNLNVPPGQFVFASGELTLGTAAVDVASAPQLRQLSPKGTITAGALPTVALVSGAGAQINTTVDVETHTPVTFNPGVATIATCTVALSPDNVTYSTLAVVTKPVGTVFDGEIDDITVRVPAGWYIKMTVVNATLGVTTHY